MPQPPYSKASFNANQIRQESEFVNQVQKNQAGLANSLQGQSGNSSARTNVSITEAVNNTLMLAQLLAPLLDPKNSTKTSSLPRKDSAAAKRAASGKPVGTREKAIEFAKSRSGTATKEESPIEEAKKEENKNTEEVNIIDLNKLTKEFLEKNPQLITPEIQYGLEFEANRQQALEKAKSERRQDAQILKIDDLRNFIETQKQSNPDKPIDFSIFRGYKLEGNSDIINNDLIPGSFYGSTTAGMGGGSTTINFEKNIKSQYLVRNIVRSLDVANSNFFENVNVDNVYFLGGKFSGCRIPNPTWTTFDGSDLTNADMSGDGLIKCYLGRLPTYDFAKNLVLSA